MCGIFALFGNQSTGDIAEQRNKFIELSKRQRHRGPDWSGIWLDADQKAVICHERLSVVGVSSGSQPIHNKELGIVLSVNGEIYNYKTLYNDVLYNKYTPQTKSDCEVIIYLYKEYGPLCVKMLDGIFGFVLFDTINQKVLVARDPIGIIPLYWGITESNEIYFASELKSIHDQCVKGDGVNVFPPSNYYVSDLENVGMVTDDKFSEYFSRQWDMDCCSMECSKDDLEQRNTNSPVYNLMSNIRQSLTESVKKRLMTEVPYGVLLSGGLDSSLVCSIVSRLRKQSTEDCGWGGKLHTFSIGLVDAPDFKYARKVAEFCDTVHHEYTFTVQEGIDAISELIYHLETFDVTTIRASAPMYLMSRLIKSLGIKMVLSGEGADEALGGYLYFHNAPNDEQFHEECVSRVNALSHFDCLRANKSTMSWGLEARVPFLDRSFLQTIMPVHPSLKLNKEIKSEKYILRKAFSEEVCGEKYLPDEILWRQKEQFSDGVGYSWIDGVKQHAENQISEEEFTEEVEKMKSVGETDIPRTREALYYRRIFDKLFPNRSSIVPRWVPRTDWDGVSYDPSGRAQKVHNNAL